MCNGFSSHCKELAEQSNEPLGYLHIIVAGLLLHQHLNLFLVLNLIGFMKFATIMNTGSIGGAME